MYGQVEQVSPMRSITALEAHQTFLRLLSAVEGGEEFVITKHGRPVAIILPCIAPLNSPEREAAIKAAVEMMERGVDLGPDFRMPTREAMHER
jgi:prevent-host-death family protein